MGSTYAERAAVGQSHEQRVARELEVRGWTVAPWGQGILPDRIKRAIRDTGSKFRHFPDIVAARPGELIAIDAKDQMHSTETGRYAISRECVAFGLQFYAAFGLPAFYVFGNLGVLCPTEVLSYGRIGPGASGGAYHLVSGRLAHQFDDVFGRPVATAVA
jgi:Holliday junction resolvase